MQSLATVLAEVQFIVERELTKTSKQPHSLRNDNTAPLPLPESLGGENLPCSKKISPP